jgi:hypothetical protein
MKNGGVQIVYVHRLLDRFISRVDGSSVSHAAIEAAPGNQRKTQEKADRV